MATQINNAAPPSGMRAGGMSPDAASEHAIDMVQWASAMSDKLARMQMFALAAKKINEQQ